MNESSDEEHIDALNYKGIYYGNGNDDHKNHDPATGAHFKIPDLRSRLEKVLRERSVPRPIAQLDNIQTTVLPANDRKSWA